MQPATFRARSHGFTLMETLVTMAIMIVLAGAAAPSFSSLLSSVRVRTAGSDLFTSLVRARSEAIKRNTDVSVVPVGGNWASGWTVTSASSTTPLESHGAVGGVATSGSTSFVFAGTGRVRATAAPAVTIRSSSSSSSAARCIRVDLSGRPNSSTSACT